MKKILLASVALTAFAGAAAAEVSLTWGGTATVGMARQGGLDAGTASTTVAKVEAAFEAAVQAEYDAVYESTVGDADAKDLAATAAADELADAILGNTETALSSANYPFAIDTDLTAEELADARAALAQDKANAQASLAGADLAAALAEIARAEAILDAANGSAATSTGDFDSYSEVNLTATATVTTDYGITVTGAVSVDAGTGYDFADDDGFDAAKTNGVALDYITIDGGSFGALTFDKNDIAHLVDGDDDETGDLKYTNDFGVASFALVMDIAKDTDVTARRAGFAYVAGDETADAPAVGAVDLRVDHITYNAAVAADVAWSAKVSAPVGDLGTVYGAFDEEGGNAFGASFLVSGVTIGLDSKLEALEEELGEDRSNTLSLAYAVDGLSLGASWNSVEDGNQWAVNAAYEANGMAVAFDTNEADEWTATASYDLSDAATVDLGVNYTEDAFVGLSLAF